MKKIASNIFYVLLVLLPAKAENIQFTASAPRVVEVGEQFEITYTINAQPSGFRPPEFKGLSLIGGPSQSSSSSIQFINGKVSQSVTFSYSYYFTATKTGTFSFDPAKATVDGKTYLSNSITIEVVGENKQAGGGNQGASGNISSGSKDKQDEIVAESGNDDIFIRILTDKSSVYQGEHIIATIKLYSRLNISAIEKADYPNFNGFFRQDIETPPLQRLEREVVNGQVYGTGVIQQMVLIPQKSGQITIDPFSLHVIVQVPISTKRPRSIWDDFWGPQVKEIRKQIESKPVKIHVKPLPSNAPVSFNGAVGKFNFKATLDRNQVKTNDAINLKITISGNGNLKIIQPFSIKFPTDFESYDPKTIINTKATLSGIEGSKSFEYLLIPRHSGTYKIPPVEFTWFDSQSKQYQTVRSDEFVITVEKSGDENKTTVVRGIDKEDVKFIGKDILFIKTQVPKFYPKNYYYTHSYKYWFLYLIILLIFLVITVLLRNYIKANADVKIVRSRKANKVAVKRLNTAFQYLVKNKLEEFYENTHKAIWGYLSDKLVIPVADLSRETVYERLQQHQINKELIDKLMKIIDSCEFARYAPSQAENSMKNIYDETIAIISSIEQNFKK